MAGRPQSEFTAEQLEQIDKMAYIQAKDGLIAEVLGIPVSTFKEHFRRRCVKKRAEGKIFKLEQQFGDKSPTMLIWWGKQNLGQTDKQEIGGGDKPIKVKVEYMEAKNG